MKQYFSHHWSNYVMVRAPVIMIEIKVKTLYFLQL